jgi:type IV secretory pathway VirD2 relaxase
MYEAILEKLAEKAPRKINDEDARLNREVKRLLANIKSKSSRQRSGKSLRGGLQSMGARGVLVKEGNIFSRRVIVKASYIQSSNEKARARIRHHLTYVGRSTLDDQKNSPELYSADDKSIAIKDKIDDFDSAPHMFNIIVSPEDGEKLNLKEFTRDFIGTVEKDLHTKLDWVAGNHYDTNDPHVHILIKGIDDSGNKLLMTRDYISRGLRARACQIANSKLGLRSHEEIVESLELKITSTKKCELDDIIVRNCKDHRIDLKTLNSDASDDLPRSLFERRLQFLEDKGIARRLDAQTWRLSESLHADLRNLDKTSLAIQRISGGMIGGKQACEIVSVKNLSDRFINGHVVERGYVEDHSNKEFLLVKSKDKKLIYVELEKYSEKTRAQSGEFVRIDVTKPFGGPLTADITIEKVARLNDGVYDAQQHASSMGKNVSLPPGVTAREYAQVHVNRLEVLARKNLVETLGEGKFRIAEDHLERLTIEAKKSESGYQPHIKVIRLSSARLKSNELHRGLSQ